MSRKPSRAGKLRKQPRVGKTLRRRKSETASRPARPETTLKQVPEDTLRRLIFRTFGHQRFTQDSPIQPDVWLAYAKAAENIPIDLIITPKAGHAPGSVATLLETRLEHYHGAQRASWQNALIAYSRSSVVAKLTFGELMRVVVPMTTWWRALPPNYRSFDAVEDRLADLKHERTEFKKIATRLTNGTTSVSSFWLDL